jgi:hypothetical protein
LRMICSKLDSWFLRMLALELFSTTVHAEMIKYLLLAVA